MDKEVNVDTRVYSQDSASSSPLPSSKVSPTHILIVDDIVTNLRIAEALMSPFCSQIDTCTSGEEAVELARQTDYSIVFMDHMMPGMDGIEAAAKIRKLKNKQPILIALTANTSAGTKELFLENGFDDFLTKPIEIPRLNSIFERWTHPPKKQGTPCNETPTSTLIPLEVPTNNEEVTFDLPDVDFEQGLRLSGGSAESYRLVLAAFVSDGNRFLEELPDSINRDTLAFYTTKVHGLKSAAASLGAQNLSDQARLLEDAGKRNDLDFVIENNPRFLACLHEFLVAAQKITRETAITKGDSEGLIELLTSLKAALNEYRINDADTIFSEMVNGYQEPRLMKHLSEIGDDILVSDYDEALDRIETLLASLSSER